MLSRIWIKGERPDQRHPQHQRLNHMGLKSSYLKSYKFGHFIVLFFYFSPRPLWAAVLVKCRFLNILPCSRVCRISNYGNSRSLWHGLWCCGGLWSGLSPFIYILINILWVISVTQMKYHLLKIWQMTSVSAHSKFHCLH